MGSDKIYIAIDLKSFYASVEAVDLGLDPLTANLVVADPSRTEKTICLAVSPSLKAYGISGRARLFEVVQKVKQANSLRRSGLPQRKFTGRSCDAKMLERDPRLEIDYVIAPPQMAHYMEVSTKIYHIYLKYVAPEDIHVYSIDEVFMDVTEYLGTYRMTARELAMKMIQDVLSETKITATAGIAPNLYLCKVAMDIVAKHVAADQDGVRIAELDEMSYRQMLWDHRPLTDFWRVGKGYARKLEENGMILFLPFLFHCICELEVSDRKKERIWKEFICHDIVEALDRSFKKGSLTAFDVQRMKQLCRHMAWKMLVREKWMQELENQEEMLSSLEADVKFLERVHEMEMSKKEQQYATPRCVPVPDSEL